MQHDLFISYPRKDNFTSRVPELKEKIEIEYFEIVYVEMKRPLTLKTSNTNTN